mmetsp:Transcript_56172/g.77869  ORF Transcript_56172/g.77869 Transcript_56172/m.77869 type:complete len:100 (-) Transcript_56172:540-839(-)
MSQSLFASCVPVPLHQWHTSLASLRLMFHRKSMFQPCWDSLSQGLVQAGKFHNASMECMAREAGLVAEHNFHKWCGSPSSSCRMNNSHGCTDMGVLVAS